MVVTPSPGCGSSGSSFRTLSVGCSARTRIGLKSANGFACPRAPPRLPAYFEQYSQPIVPSAEPCSPRDTPLRA